jgi:hypothetical protein
MSSPQTVAGIDDTILRPAGLRPHEVILAAPRAALVEPVVVAFVVAFIGVVAGVLLAAYGSLPDATTVELSRVEAAVDGGGMPGALVGSEEPILFSVLMLPAALLGGLLPTKLLLVLPSALAGGAIAGVLDAAQRTRRVSMPVRLAATAVAVLNPITVYLMASGLPTLPAAACVVVGLYGILEWIRTRDLRWMLWSSLLFTIGTLLWYPVLTWSVAALVTLIIVSMLYREGAQGTIGVLILYAFPFLVAAGLWTLAVERTTGEMVPWMAEVPLPGTEVVMDTGTFLALIVPCALATAVALIAMARRRRPSTWATVGALIFIPLAVVVAWRLAVSEPAGIGTTFFVVVPFAAVLFAAMVQGELRRGPRIAIYAAVIGLLVVASGAMGLWITGASDPVATTQTPDSIGEVLSSLR